ncbi:MAG: hypothetical protein AAF721_07705 [Myxococcota bacterium]
MESVADTGASTGGAEGGTRGPSGSTTGNAVSDASTGTSSSTGGEGSSGSTGTGSADGSDSDSTGEAPSNAFECEWQDAEIIPSSDATTFIHGLQFDGNGQATLLTVDPSEDSMSAHARRFDGVAWSPEVEIASVQGPSAGPWMTFGSSGVGAFAWSDGSSAVGRVFTPPGWGAALPIDVDATGDTEFGVHVAVDALGNAAAVWTSGVPQVETEINLARLPAGEAQWSEPIQLNVDFVTQAGGRIATGGDHMMFVVWDESAEINARTYDSDAGTLGEQVMISPGLQSQLAADLQGNAIVVRRSGGTMYSYRHDGATQSWGAAQVATDAYAPGGTTRTVMMPGGNPLIVLGTPTEGQDSSASVLEYDAAKGEWAAPIVLDDEDHAFAFDIAFNAHGHAVAIWRSGDNLRSACRDADAGEWGPVVDVDTQGLLTFGNGVALSDDNHAIISFTSAPAEGAPNPEAWVVHSH